MNDPDLSPDDPRLTAFALGELEGDERAHIEAAVHAHAELRARVEEVRAMSEQLQAALIDEPRVHAEPFTAQPFAPMESVGASRSVSYGPGALTRLGQADVSSGRVEAPRPQTAFRRGKLIRFPQFYYLVGGMAAAAVAVMVAFNREEIAARDQARGEAMRMAIERRFKSNAGRATLELFPAPETTAQTSTVAASDADAARGLAFGPGNLALLQQVHYNSGAPVQTRDSNAASAAVALSAREQARVVTLDFDLQQLPQARLVATTAPGHVPTAAVGSRPAVLASEPVTIDYTPSLRSLDARHAIGGPLDLFPGPRKVFAPPPTIAAPTGEYSRTPARDSEVITLNTFTVSAPRPTTYGASSAARRSEYDPMAEDRDHRPRAPLGTRFGRNPSGEVRENEFTRVAHQSRSTFAADTETASYSALRRMIRQRELPPRDLVKIEELLNYFPYQYAVPPARRALTFLDRVRGEDPTPPFAASLEVADAPWAPTHRLVRIGLKARDLPTVDRPGANLVFLVDVSTSMNAPNRLPLVKESLRLLLEKLRRDDHVSIVTYGGETGVALQPTSVARASEIRAAIDALTPGGVPRPLAAVRIAYDLAREHLADDAINRVILCTDGDFNLGPSSEAELLRLVEDRAMSGVFLTVLGFGMGSYRDEALERLADHGKGNFGYIDSRLEAQRVLAEQVSSTLATVAKDVKIQVQFNPAQVSSYRLIGFENRLLRREDFNDDRVDGGEIGAGHSITALYEIVPVGAEDPLESRNATPANLKSGGDPLSNSRVAAGGQSVDASKELLTVAVRYKRPSGWFGRKVEFPATDSGAKFAQASADFRFAAAVAQFGMILRKSAYRGNAGIGDVIAWAAAAAANPVDDPGGYRGEFIDLARQAQELLRSE